MHDELVPSRLSRFPKLGVFPVDRIGSKDVEVKRRIEEYSKRSLTYEGDIINALLGLLKLFEQEHQIRHVWGLPYPVQDPCRVKYGSITRLRKAAFVDALCWKLRSPSTRRKSFPSWSWTGWRGAIHWPSSFGVEAHLGIPATDWGPSAYEISNPDFSIRLETTHGALIDWALCESHHDDAIEYRDSDEYHDDAKLGRFMHMTCYISSIYSLTSTSKAKSCVETQSALDNPVYINVDIRLVEQLPDGQDLYALHMPWNGDSRFIIIRNVEEYWERVGTGRILQFTAAIGGRAPMDRVKKTWTKIRLG